MVIMQEDSRIEFKSEMSESISKAAVAFSNTSGGSIYVGIGDNGDVIGIDDHDSSSIRCVQLLNDTVKQDIMLTSDITDQEIDGKHVLIIPVS